MIYDCFPFYNELMLLEIRLKELSPVIDKFVLVESTRLWTGEKKRLYYNEVKDNGVFGQFKDKIIHIIYDEPAKSVRWDNENEQRNAIGRALVDAKPDDIIIVSDADEIINSKVFDEIRNVNLPCRIRMKTYYYYFNCRANRDTFVSTCCRFEHYIPAHNLRCGKGNYGMILNGGWHFAYLMPVNLISHKISIAAHIEYDTNYFKDKKRIQKCLDSNTDLFERPHMRFSIQPLDAPACVMENCDKYKDFIK